MPITAAGEEERMQMTVVLAHAPGPSAEAAFAAAVHEAGLRGRDLVIANAASDDALADSRAVGAPALRDLAERAGRSGVRARPVGLSDADAVGAVLALAEQEDAEVLVVGVRRRSAVGKLLLGSTAQRLLLEARCPVLAVKA